MKIGELSERTGLNPSRIRFYESIGLFKMAERQSNGYRIYPPEAVLVLNLIATAQQAGFSLDELRMLLPTDMAAWQHGSLIDTLQRKVVEISKASRRTWTAPPTRKGCSQRLSKVGKAAASKRAPRRAKADQGHHQKGLDLQGSFKLRVAS